MKIEKVVHFDTRTEREVFRAASRSLGGNDPAMVDLFGKTGGPHTLDRVEAALTEVSAALRRVDVAPPLQVPAAATTTPQDDPQRVPLFHPDLDIAALDFDIRAGRRRDLMPALELLRRALAGLADEPDEESSEGSGEEPSWPGGGIWDGPAISYEEDPSQYIDPPEHAP